MKKKQINIILLIAVCAIWGILIYQYVNGLLHKQTMPDKAKHTTLANKTKLTIKKAVHITALKRDPFLGKVSNWKASVPIHTTSVIPTQQQPMASIAWPAIEYLGYMKEITDIQPLVVLKVNSTIYKTEPTAIFANGIKIKRFYRDSIQLEYQKSIKVFKKVILKTN